jgi:AcrR family transcriptional regulator
VNKNEENKLEIIFSATLNLTEKVGLGGLKMSDIAKEANIATGTLYIYFKSKEELLNALYIEVKKVSASAIVSEITHLPINIQLYKMWKTALNSIVSNYNRIIFLEQFVGSQYISEINKSKEMAFAKYLKDLLENGKNSSEIKDVEIDILTSLVIGFLRNYAFHLVRNNNGQLTEELIDKSFSLCWEAIKK